MHGGDNWLDKASAHTFGFKFGKQEQDSYFAELPVGPPISNWATVCNTHSTGQSTRPRLLPPKSRSIPVPTGLKAEIAFFRGMPGASMHLPVSAGRACLQSRCRCMTQILCRAGRPAKALFRSDGTHHRRLPHWRQGQCSQSRAAMSTKSRIIHKDVAGRRQIINEETRQHLI